MPVEWTELVGPLLALAANVAAWAGEAQRYRKKCRLLQSRVQMIWAHLNALQQTQWTPDPLATKDTLNYLDEVLHRAEVLLESCRRKTTTFDFLYAFKNQGEFAFVNEQISHILETFHLSNHTLLLLDHNNRIFMVVFDTLIEDGACRRLPQGKRGVVEESLSRLRDIDIDKMPPDQRSRLQRIRRELRAGSSPPRQSSDAASASSGNRGQQHQKDPVLAQVNDLARAIVEEAKAARSHNKEEVQRVAQLAEKVIYHLLPYLRPPLLTRNQDTITELLDNLRTTTQHRPLHCGPSALMPSSSWREQAERLVELGNGIERSYQALMINAVLVQNIMRSA
ncbi:uncharacterized protein LOC120666464 [Panicum virgatum]|uniref:uncharacterized protein LOC120666464 n=1 Tax=Panicum virgatum TaxID=38727 RepID=UPI0019D5B2CD|nr:uncharacterized protein LOC120666464 [Panicum virgatum]XP_039802250.1 uncharacterized protein LOC120666464 [Panicum virgatum]